MIYFSFVLLGRIRVVRVDVGIQDFKVKAR